MKTTLVTASALALALVAPLSVSAQQAPPPGYQTQQSQDHAHMTPDEPTMQRHWQKRLGGLNLSGGQQQRISSIIHGFARMHPAGSPPDHAGNHALKQRIMAVLSPGQVQQYREMMRQRHSMHKQNGQGENQPDDQGQYQQGQYQQGPPQQYGDPRDQQQGPPQQGSQGQGPPPDYQGPQDQGQGPPPDYQGPPDQGQGPPDQGQGPPDQGQGPPDQGQGPPDQGQGPPPDQGQGPPPDQGQGPPPA